MLRTTHYFLHLLGEREQIGRLRSSMHSHAVEWADGEDTGLELREVSASLRQREQVLELEVLHSSLLTAHCSLLTTHCSLLTAHYSLLTTHCSLLTTHCSLLTTHRIPPTPCTSRCPQLTYTFVCCCCPHARCADHAHQVGVVRLL